MIARERARAAEDASLATLPTLKPLAVGPSPSSSAPSASTPVIQLDGVIKRFGDGVMAVDHTSLRVDAGKVVVLLGPSGSGKTTILRLIAGFDDGVAHVDDN